MDIGAFIEGLERRAPPDLAEEFDEGKIGLIIEGRKSVNRICCALDATPPVVQRAVELKADMLVVHHTPLWDPVTRLTGRTATLLRMLLSADLNLYVMHTNFDHAHGGVNDALCRLLSLTEVTPLTLGMIGTCGISLEEIARRLSCSLRIWGQPGTLSRIAVVGGSGFSLDLIEEAADKGAGAFLSAELKHAVARAAPIPCIEATHYALEAPAMRFLAEENGWVYIDDPPAMCNVP